MYQSIENRLISKLTAYQNNQTGNVCTINVTFRHVRESIVALEKR